MLRLFYFERRQAESIFQNWDEHVCKPDINTILELYNIKQYFLRRNNTANSGQVDQKALEIYKDIDLSLREKYYAEMGLNIIWVDDFDEIPQILKGLL